MAFTPSFSSAQPLGSPSKILLVDTSTGSDAAIASRVIYLQKSDGTFIVPLGTSTQYIVWSLINTSITVDCLDKDYALLITVNWLDINGNVLYSKNYVQGQTLYNESFDYYLAQMMVANPLLINDNNFFDRKSVLRNYIDSGNQALLIANDIATAQILYNSATALRTSSQYYFNANG